MNTPPFARWILRGFAVLVSLALTLFLAIYSFDFRQKSKAEALLKDIRTLRVGQSTKADVERIMSHHGGGPSQSSTSSCDPVDGAYDVWTGSETIVWLEQSIHLLSHLGRRMWGTAATVILHEGKVCFLSYGVGMEDPERKWEWSVETKLLVAGAIFAPDGSHPGYETRTRDYKGVRRLTSNVTTDATEEERRRAFTYDLSCVTSFRGCRQRCQIAPLVWQDEYHASLKNGTPLPTEETTDSRCKPLETAP